MKQSSVVGTPINSVKGPSGIRPGVPNNQHGTVPKQYEGDQKGNQQVGIATGTPFTSKAGNPANARRVVSLDKYGMVESNGQGDMNNPRSNGNGTIFEVQTGNDMLATSHQTMDSPVPEGAQRPDNNASEILANLRSGSGKAWGPGSGPGNNALEMGGVLSRGMLGTSKPSGGELEMTEDDVLLNEGPGGAVG